MVCSGSALDFDSETFIAEIAGTLPAGGNATGGDRQPGMGQETADTMLVAHSLRAQGQLSHRADQDTLVAHSLRADGFDASEDGTGRGTPLIAVPFDTTQITSAANYSAPKDGDPCHPIATTAHPPAVAYRITPNDGAYETGDTTGTLTTGTDNSAITLLQGWAVRRLTPRECERLMGLADDFTLITYRGKPAADGPRYKALGNSQARNMMRWIAHGLAAVNGARSQKEIAA